MTDAAFRVFFAAAGRRSMRAPIVDCRLARHIDVVNFAAERVRAGLAVHHPAFGQIAHHLLGEERVSGGPVDDSFDEGGQ